MQRFAAVLTAVLAVGGPLLVLLGTMAVAIGALASPVGLVIGALVLLGVAAAANWGRLSGAVQRAVAVATPALTSLQDTIAGLRSGDLSFREVGAGLLAELQQLPARIQSWAGSVDWSGLIDSAGSVGTSWRVKIEGWLGDALAQVNWEDGVATGGAWIEGLRTSLTAKVESGLAEAAAGLQSIAAVASPIAGALQESLSSALAEAMAQASSTLATMGETVAPIKDAVVSWFAGLTWGDVASTATSALDTLGATVNGWRDSVLGLVTGWVDGIDWSTLSLDFSGFVDRLTEGIRGIDMSKVPLSEIFTTLTAGPMTAALAGVQWVIGSEQFTSLSAAVSGAISSIQWNEVLASVGGLADASLGLVTDAANSLIQGYIDKIAAVDWTQLSVDFAGLLTRISDAISTIDWQQVGASIGTHLRELFVGNEQGEGGLVNLATAVYDAIVAIDWYAVLTATGDLVLNLGNAILQVVGSAIATLFGATLDGNGAWTAPQWVVDLQVWLDGVLETPAWVVTLGEWWANVTQTPAWVVTIGEWWTRVTTAPGWIDTLLGWQEWLGGFEWPSIREPDWLADVRSWWNNRPWWLGETEARRRKATRLGTPNWPGGWTRVGEYGPELVRLPAGSQIFDHRESAAMAAGGQTVNITANIHQDLDWEQLRWKLQELTRRRS